MINQNFTKKIMEEYNVDVLNDVFLAFNHHVTFCFDWQNKSKKLYILTGDLSLLGLPKKDIFTFGGLRKYIECDNALAEVEGKETFLKDLVYKLSNIVQDTQLYIPLKSETGILWLLVGFEVLTKKYNKNQLIIGKVHKTFKETPAEITYYKLTYQDPLTRLFTRETLKVHIEHATYLNGAYGLYFDLDNFKKINDVYGHQMGDNFLIAVADYFISKWERDVIYYRLGGDEFFVYVINHTEDQVMSRASSIIYNIENLILEGKEVRISASVGIVPIHKENCQYMKLLDLGDKAMYLSKAKGKGLVTLLKDV